MVGTHNRHRRGVASPFHCELCGYEMRLPNGMVWEKVITEEDADTKLKHCPKCGIDKPLRAFSRCKTRRDGLQGYCRPCKKVHERYMQQKYPEKYRARELAKAHKDKIKKSACERCGTKEKLHMHHPDYSRPLDVVTLCPPCHVKAHFGENK